MRILLALLFLLLLATFAPLGRTPPEPPPAVTELTFTPVNLLYGDPGHRAAGRLVYLGGWRIGSNDRRFGGISALHVAGGRAIAVSDTGALIRFALPGSPPSARIDALPDGPGSAEVKSQRDAEAMVVDGATAWIGFERSNAVWRYRLPGWRSDSAAAPPAMRRWRSNRGSEAMVRLPGGRFLIFSEGSGGGSPVLLFAGDPAVAGSKSLAMRYRPPDGYRITDAALLPDGRLLLLNRRVTFFEGISAKLIVAALPKPVAGATIAGEEVADLRSPLTIDNMEAMSVGREGGRTIVWLASDDNFNPLQRTLLLKFALAD
jgi:hypothetical protein